MGKPKNTQKFDKPVLVLNGTEDRLQLVLEQDGVVGAAQEWTVPGRAMQFLAPALKTMLESMNLEPAALAGIACVRGPGSFTGLRMVMATALGVARAAGVPMAGLDYLPLLGAGPAALVDGTIAAITHSRTRQVYVQAFNAKDASPLAAPAPYSLEEAEAYLKTLPRPLYLLGSGIRRNQPFFDETPLDATILPPMYDHPAPECLAAAAENAEFTTTAVDPLYLRASDAEDNLRQIASKRGMDPDEAERRLKEATTDVRSPNPPSAEK